MISGHVVALHVLLPVQFRLPELPDIAFEFVVDTGFTGELTLPLAAIEKLELDYVESISANLATDEEVELPVYAGFIFWEGVEREVRVLATGRRPLLGTALLEGLDLYAQFREGGLVALNALE